MARICSDGLELRLDEAETALVRRVLVEQARRTDRAGFAREQCEGGAHPLGTEQRCGHCVRYRAAAVVRKG